ncbi:acyltransferase family protein [Mesorhizobium sp. ZMM04-5]|uniref:Acyltransferase family protein n=1 Tax=Mesorhizobium marinum TaxID=3228790 RepID=A0ABV3R469_9HYPH
MSDIASVRGRHEAVVPTTQTAARTREHVAYIEYFRALAILLIVCGHTFALAWTHFADEDPTTRIALINVIPSLINSGTAYFVFISGFLYRQVFHGRMAYGEFMRRKALYIGLPYLFMATPIALAEIAAGAFYVESFKDGVAYPHSGFVDLVVLMTTGRMVNAYWYIPFIFLVFLASPLFDRFIRMKPGPRLALVAVAFLVAMWVHRPLDNLNPFHSFLYFANIYMFGMVFWEYRERILAVVARPGTVALLAILMLATAVVQALVLNNTSNIERAAGDGWLPLAFDMMLVQKYVGFFLFCGFFALWGRHAAKPLSFIAKNSFGLYFVHAIVIAVLMRMPEVLSPHVGEPMADLALYFALVLAISFAAILTVKAITGKYSRYIIGC